MIFEIRERRCLVASIRKTAKVRPTTLDLCCSPLALMTLRMLSLLLFMSISNFLVSPFSASSAKAGLAISPYLEIFYPDLTKKKQIQGK